MTTKRNNLKGTAILLGLVAASFILTGCESESAQDMNPLIIGQWRQMPAHEQNHVEMVTLEHIVAFAPSAIRPGDREFSRMLDFIQESELASTDDIFLDAPRSAAGIHDAVNTARLEVLEGEFLQLGLPVEIADEPMAGSANADRVVLVVKRAVAIPPDCDVEQPGLAQRPDWKVGCAVNASLGLMVADPRDLIRGRTLGPVDAESASKAVQVYRDPTIDKGESDVLQLELTTGN